MRDLNGRRTVENAANKKIPRKEREKKRGGRQEKGGKIGVEEKYRDREKGKKDGKKKERWE